jgi:hypothetical protein
MDAALARAISDIQPEYLPTMTNPLTVHAMCEDYRASASIAGLPPELEA